MYLTDLANIARGAGLKVIEVPGWKTRGHGGMTAVRTITCHHTANGGAKGNYPSLNVVRSGRPGLSGPLSHFGIGVDGTVYVIAAGLAWHAGASKSSSYANPYAIGIEAEAVGVPGAKGDWPEVQMVAYAKLCKALADRYNLPYSQILGHKETAFPAGRKTDPSFDMDAFRRRVQQIGKITQAEELVEMEWTDKVKLTATDAKVWNEWGKTTQYKEGSEVSVGEMLRYPTLLKRIDLKLSKFIASQK